MLVNLLRNLKTDKDYHKDSPSHFTIRINDRLNSDDLEQMKKDFNRYHFYAMLPGEKYVITDDIEEVNFHKIDQIFIDTAILDFYGCSHPNKEKEITGNGL